MVDLVVDFTPGSDWVRLDGRSDGSSDRRLDERENCMASLEWFSWVMTMHRTLVVFKMLTHDVFVSVYL